MGQHVALVRWDSMWHWTDGTACGTEQMGQSLLVLLDKLNVNGISELIIEGLTELDSLIA